jgi:hypothetical protein
MKVLQHTHFKNKCTGNIKTIDEYKQKYPNAPLMCEDLKKSSALNLANMILKYGEEEGHKRWDAYRAKQAYTNSFEYFQKTRGWTLEQFQTYNNSRAVTLENLIKKHGIENGTTKYKIYCEKQAKNGNKLEYFIEKYGEEQGTIKYNDICKAKAQTLENMQKLYGTEEGLIKFHNYQEKIKTNYISLLGREIVTSLCELLPPDWIFHEGIYGKEFCVYKDRPYFFDFVITFPFLACIEINGDYWHANPNLYEAEQEIQYPNQTFIKAKDIWEKDEKKLSLIRKRGYNIKIIWEADYNRDKKLIISEAFEWLKSLEKK